MTRLDATSTPEQRGLRRDEVRLMVVRPGTVEHTCFRGFAGHLRPGDLLVVNTSATLPAALDGHRSDGAPVVVHLSTRLDDGTWLVELRPPGPATGPVRDAVAGERLRLPAGGRLVLLAPHPGSVRLWRSTVSVEGTVEELLARSGRPVTYAHLTQGAPIEAFQTVFASQPGSAEMPSAGRPFSGRVVLELVTRGVTVAPVTLHTGLSSPEAGEPPSAEPYDVPAHTARLVELTRRAGGRVVAVGTTVTRALESVAAPDGTVRAGRGWTDLVLGRERPARVVDGLVTGWHAAGATHLRLLEAVAGRELVEAAYLAADADGGYRWHEMGDSCLLLP